VQRELAAATPAERGFWLGWRIHRHLRRCPACAHASRQVRQLERETRAWLNDQPPAALRDRIAAAISVSEPAAVVSTRSSGTLGFSHIAESLKRLKEKQTMNRRLALALTISAVGAVFAAGMWHDTASAELLRIQAAVGKARSVYAVYSVIGPAHQPSPRRQLWYQDGRWRLEVAHQPTRIYTDGKLWRYDPAQRKASDASGSFPAIPAELQRWAASGFVFEELMQDLGRSRWQGKIHRLGPASLDGHTARQIVISDADEGPEPVRLLFWIDDQTDLPLRVEKQHEINGQWTAQVMVQFQFNQALPARLFDPESLSGAATR
jgi:hypothetical protein